MFDKKAHWQNVYQEKSLLDVSWYQKKPQTSLELISQTGISKDEPIIDVGGGASVLVEFLCKEDFTNLSVLDISANALDKAKQRLGNVADDIEWIESDITEFKSSNTFSLWHDRAVFHFLTSAHDRKMYADTLSHSLKAGGHLVIATFGIGGPDKCSGLDIVQYDSSKLKAELGEEYELLEEREEIHITPSSKAQKFMYFRFIRSVGTTMSR